MKILRGFFLIFIFSVSSVNVFAQFNITKVNTDTVETRTILNPASRPAIVKNDYLSRTRLLVERRDLRRKRNTVEFNSGLNLTQTQFKNWAAGGDNSFSGKATLYLRHQLSRNRFGLDYKIDTRYGISRIDKKNFKNEDQFIAAIMTTWKINKTWSYAASANLRSQFSTSYKSRTDHTRVSTLMAPGFLDVAVGFTYIKKAFNIVISPVGGSAVFVFDDQLSKKGINGLSPGERAKWKVGPSVRINYDKQFAKDIFRLRSELYSFTNVKSAPTARWESTLMVNATKYFSTTLYALLYYDKEAQTPKPDQLQFKYSISVGLVYNIKNK